MESLDADRKSTQEPLSRPSVGARIRTAINEKQDKSAETCFRYGLHGSMQHTTDSITGLRFISVRSTDPGLDSRLIHEKRFGDEHQQVYRLTVYGEEGVKAKLLHRSDGSFAPYPLCGVRQPSEDSMESMVTAYEFSRPSDFSRTAVHDLLNHGID